MPTVSLDWRPQEQPHLRQGIWPARRSPGLIPGGGPAAKDALPFLAKVLGEDDKRDLAGAARAVGAMGPAARDKVPLLVKLMEDKDKKVRKAAVLALCRLGPDAPEALTSLLTAAGQDGYEGHQAADALARVGKPAVPLLIELLQGDKPIGRENAAHALRSECWSR